MTTAIAEHQSVQAIFDAYMSAWRLRDPEAIAAMHAVDGVFHAHVGTPPAVGRAAVRQACIELFAEYEDFQGAPVRLHVGSDHWVLEWTMRVKQRGTDQESISVDCVDVVQLSDEGLVLRKDAYLDVAQASAALSA